MAWEIPGRDGPRPRSTEKKQMNKTEISWTDYSWNPVTGCTPVSAGCRNCYARKMSKRLRGRFGYPADDPFRVTFHPDKLEDPLRMRKPRMIFTCSMGDLFHEDVPDEWIDQVFAVMALCPQHSFQVLTKRPERMARYFGEAASGQRKLADAACYGMSLGFFAAAAVAGGVKNWPLPNVWAGVSVEDQATADERIPHLLNTPAAVRFVSCEPLLGPVDIDLAMYGPGPRAGMNCFGHTDGFGYEALLHWIICGTESGPRRRPAKTEWIRNLRDQSITAGVPFFLKQREVDGRVVKMPMLDGEKWEQFPEVNTRRER